MSKTTQEIGHLAELQFEIHAHNKGMIISKPTRPARYDFILDDGAQRLRIQVKSCSHKDKRSDAFIINSGNGPRNNAYGSNEIDFLAVWFPTLNYFGWFPISLIANKSRITIQADKLKRKWKNTILLENYKW